MMADDKIKGLICPKCGCADFKLDDGSPANTPPRPWDTIKTVRGKNYIRRYKTCRLCGRRIRTKEIIEK